MSGLLVSCRRAPQLDLAGAAEVLPAYAHNDYENDRPLRDALARGYAGVEADVYLRDGVLLVGHDPEDLLAERTLESLYLLPLDQIVRERGTVRPDGVPFALHVEAKEPGPDTYQALRSLLERYAHMLTRVEDGVETVGAVEIVLVGHQPSLDDLRAERVRYVSAHCHFRDLPPDHSEYPAHLLRLVSVRYRDHFRWAGRGDPPMEWRKRLNWIVSAAHAVPGRRLRLFAAPRSGRLYDAALAGGVDLIGTKHLEDTAVLLRHW